MQPLRILQAVILMIVVALAASCAATKEYTSKLFTPRGTVAADSLALTTRPALRFLETDTTEKDGEDWVSTDIIMGRDSSGSTAALDKLAQTIPVKTQKTVKDTIPPKDTVRAETIMAQARPLPAPEMIPVAKAANPGEVRSKRTREK
ncbi:MAG: hypothetical protein NTW29_07145 [Bacteroidetes bacterium]|nr:hypothetical protein [Bacteroidota bacterium]